MYGGDNLGDVMSAVGPSKCGCRDGVVVEEEEEGLNSEDNKPVRATVNVTRSSSGIGILAIARRIAKRFATVRLSCEKSRTSSDVLNRWE